MTPSQPLLAKRLHPPRLTRNEAQARSVLAQRARACEVVLGNEYAMLSVEPLATPWDEDSQAIHTDETPLWRVQAEWAGAPFELLLPESACSQWLLARFADLELPRLTAPMQAAFLEAALAHALEALQRLQRGPARIDAITAAAGSPSADLPQRFYLTLHQNDQRVRVQLATNSLGLMLMAGLAAQREPEPGPLDGDSMRICLRAVIGTARLPASELAGLAAGDAIFLDHSWTGPDDALWLGIDHWGLRVRCDDTRLTVTQPFNYTEAIMDTEFDDDDGPADGGQALPLNDLPVRLQFDLGERSLTLGEVLTLQVGQVLDLARPLSQAVTIRANGAIVGTGELMEIGGRVAVGITALGRRQEPAVPPTAAPAHPMADDLSADEELAS